MGLSFWRCNLHLLTNIFPPQQIFGVVGMSISNKLVLPKSGEDLDAMLSNSFSMKAESLLLPFCGTCTLVIL